MQRTIEQDLPKEIRFLRSFDTFRAGVENMIDMPERTLNNLFGFLQQNEGRLSKRARDNEFSQLTPDEVTKIEELYQRPSRTTPEQRAEPLSSSLDHSLDVESESSSAAATKYDPKARRVREF
ncbi:MULTISPECIES: hypothetical protein [unclassified Bradyrhizobium]|uniref:hypothetical protein n=1 Tax=unclassified Bradyrhizobium TaxID=2631580 RepID=UPI001FF80E73|nr:MULTISPECIES: hypothetical protein [unclassified Bradyrhizobium]